MKRRSFVLHVRCDDTGHLYGQIIDPLSDWRRPFQNETDLWRFIENSMLEEFNPTTLDSRQTKESGDSSE